MHALDSPVAEVGRDPGMRQPPQHPDPALVDALSNETQVTSETPPTFLFHTADDDAVPVENSILFFEALRRAGVSAEMHVFAHGHHGVGLAPDDPSLSQWPGLCAQGMKNGNGSPNSG